MPKHSDAAPIVAAHDVHTHYGLSHVLRGVSIAISPGETVGLMGRNGMGKTTLIRTLVGLVAPSRGQILIDGRDVTKEPAFRRARRGLAYVPEGRGIFASLSVAENLAIAARSSDESETPWTSERVVGLFPRLKERYEHRGNQLSGGEQQMLAIGRALATNPRLLILDEATEGLAPLVREEIWRTIAHIKESGIATLIVDKSVAAITGIADRVLILVKGELAFEDEPAALLAAPELMHRHLGV